jgi:antitoxin (DNA-binding transcriptional repressor) of toxin-antitoxin stability system
MLNISAEKTPDSSFEISPMSIKRDWMDQTSENHAYRCFPVTQANVVGYSLSCKEDIEFIWDGINDQTQDHVEIVKGPQGSYGGRGQSSISLNTGLIFRTDQDVSILTINPVNYFNEDFETMSNLISTSFYDNPLPLAIKAKRAGEKVVIKSGTPLATLIPISLTQLNNTVIHIVDYKDQDRKREEANIAYGQAAQVLNSSGEWTDWYRNAVNEKQESLGSHEVKALKLVVDDQTGQNRL